MAGSLRHLGAVLALTLSAILETAAQSGETFANSVPVLLSRGGATVAVQRADAQLSALRMSGDSAAADALRRFVELQVAGPTDAEADLGLEGLIPAGTILDEVGVDNGHARVRITFPAEFVRDEFHEGIAEDLTHLSVDWMDGVPGVTHLRLEARAAGETEHRLIHDLLPPPPPISSKEWEAAPQAVDSAAETRGPGHFPVRGQGQPTGSLADASIFLSPGHGWIYTAGSVDRWATQRGNVFNHIEDHGTGEAVLQNLTHYLWNAGARVYTIRERDFQTNMVIVDNADPGFSTTGGGWNASTNVSTYHGSNYLWNGVDSTEVSTARWTPTIPEEGHYAVYYWWPQGSDRAVDAELTIHHTGGSTVWTQNLQHDGNTWKYMGTFHFEAGSHPATGSVVLSDQGGDTNQVVIADAVRFGGGMGDMVDPIDPLSAVSGFPRWEEAGRYHGGFMGWANWAAPGRASALPQYAAFEHEAWELYPSYVSWHTNAAGGTGTSSFAYSSSGDGGPFTGVTGSDLQRNLIHAEIINDIRAGWDPGWNDRGVKTAASAETNPNNNPEMPASLHEIAFHDTASDVALLKNPNFRRDMARAVYQGLVKFYSQFYGFPDTLLPEPPTHLRVVTTGPDSVMIAWNAPPSDTGDGFLGDPATGHRVYRSPNGKGFDNGTDVAGTGMIFSGIGASELVYFRVTATNAGGESFPTETLAVRKSPSGDPTLLLVNGFDRIDAAANLITDDPYDSDPLERGILTRMNTYDYAIQHAEAIDAYGTDFDSCANEAVIAGLVDLTDYDTVVWILGEESTADDTFDATEQTHVTTFLNGGGNLFVTGAEIGWDLDLQNNGRAFFENNLHANCVADGAGTHAAQGAPGSIFEGISLTFDDGAEVYDVRFPDVIDPQAGAISAMTYGGGGVSPTLVEGFNAIGGWRDPNFSGQTDADASSTFTIVGSPVREGSGAGDLFYVWGTGDFIREYNQDLPAFPAASNFSLWVNGDASGHDVRICLRDSDGDLFVSDYVRVDFSGWQEITWLDVENNPQNLWVASGNGTLDGPDVRLDSIQVQKVSGAASGHLYFDDATHTPTGVAGPGGLGAGIQFAGGSPERRIVMLGFPFETILDASDRNAVMAAALGFFGAPVPAALSALMVR
jgi:N-acetylmuramoyl-L-alanine amidase